MKILPFDSRPQMSLPGDDVTVLSFALDLLPFARANGLCRRDSVVMYPDPEKRVLERITASVFQSWLGQWIVFYKPTSFESSCMSRDCAEAILSCTEFLQGLPELESCNAVPLPVIDEGGEMRMLAPGYDVQSTTWTLEPTPT
jgi:hypothetical protein